MRYELDSMLPINAFSPRGGRGPFSRGMTLEGGGKGGGSTYNAPAPDPKIGISQDKMADISQAYLDNWKTEVWPTMKDQAEKQTIRADEQFALDKEMQQKQIAAADKAMAEYNRAAPIREAIYNEAQNYNTEANKERLTSEAIGDTKTAFGVQAQDQERKMQSYGINPTSGQFTGMKNANSVLQAATEASAATRARNAAEQLGWAKKMDAIGVSQGQFGNQATSTGLALTAGNQALNSGQIAMGNYGALGNSASQATGTANAGWGSVGNLGVQKYNADVNAYEAQVKAGATESAGFGSMVGSLAGTAAKLYLGSDIRTKENIVAIGKTKAGHTIYEYEYKPAFKDRKYFGHGRFRGVMAHEVEHIPGAVFTTEDGYKVVDYSKVS
jgi:hypothetical protein